MELLPSPYQVSSLVTECEKRLLARMETGPKSTARLDSDTRKFTGDKWGPPPQPVLHSESLLNFRKKPDILQRFNHQRGAGKSEVMNRRAGVQRESIWEASYRANSPLKGGLNPGTASGRKHKNIF